jgi:DNA-binding transcriptional MocR family regulator
LADAAAAAVAALPRHLGGAGLHPLGLPELRTAVADRYTGRGLPTDAEEVLVTSGALHAWDLLLRVLTRPGATVITEQPTYPGVLDAALAHHVRVQPLPVDADGWDLSQLPRLARPAALAHVTFDGQNPTGLWSPDRARRRLLAALDPATVVVADESLVELGYPEAPHTRPAPALADRSRTVVAVGSMSKSFWAGIRVGWVRGPAELVRRLAVARAGQDLATALLDQLLAAELLAAADDVLPARRETLAARRDAVLDVLATETPGWSAAVPRGGLAVWVELAGASSTRLAQHALAQGVRVTPGPRFTVTGTHDRWLRLPFVQPPDRLADAVRRLVAAAAEAGPATGRRRSSADTAWTA